MLSRVPHSAAKFLPIPCRFVFVPNHSSQSVVIYRRRQDNTLEESQVRRVDIRGRLAVKSRFSNSLIINKEKTKKIDTVTERGLKM